MGLFAEKGSVEKTIDAQLTQEQAIAFAKSDVWKSFTYEQIVALQLFQRRLCVPFDVFHEAIEKVLGRPVWTHEFASPELLKLEYLGIRAKPSLEEIMNLIPKDKLILIMGRVGGGGAK